MTYFLKDIIKKNTDFNFDRLSAEQQNFVNKINGIGDDPMEIYGNIKEDRAMVFALIDPMSFNMEYQNWKDEKEGE